MIKELVVKGETLINVPANKSVLVELGLTEAQADEVLTEYGRTVGLEAIRTNRVPLLIEADYLVNIALDNGVDIAPYRQYRQQLRDITALYSNLGDVVWPQKPALPQSA